MTETQYKHWRMNTDSDNILWLFLDREGTTVNSLNREVFNEFESVIGEITQKKPRAVILTSGKKKGFIAGADVSQFTSLKESDEAYDLVRQAQLILNQFEALPMPTVAMISGFCLGGGYEIALACSYRVAEESASTQIGLPEVKLGIQPGWGGTVRLPALIGAAAAMKVMLPGATYSAEKAKCVGMIDAAVPKRQLERAARHYALTAPRQSRAKGWARFSNISWVRRNLGKVFLRHLTVKVREDHYPAPYAIVRNWVKEGVSDQAYRLEAKSITNLLLSDTSRRLVRIFFQQNRLKALAKKSKFNPTHVHVVGAGVMGGDIAAWCAYKGIMVTLQDQSAQKISPAIQRAHKLYTKKLKKPSLVRAAMDRLLPDVNGYGVSKADIVIEAIFENLGAKQELFKKLEKVARPEAILATNTSSIPLDEIAQVLQQPNRLVGIHFFNPVAKMQLVEVVQGEQTDSDIVDKVQSFVGRLSRLPLPVTSTPGFLVNRILMPYLLEAMTIYEEGVSATAIDQAAIEFGMPVGPIALADSVGLDICLSVANIMKNYYKSVVPKKLAEMVQKGKLGRKSGQGFYRYKNARKIAEKFDNKNIKHDDLADRMILRMLNEAVVCLAENVVLDSDLLDVGIVFGTGFAPFRGGPMAYAKSRGVSSIIEKLQQLEKKYGARFAPSEFWQDKIDACQSEPADNTIKEQPDKPDKFNIIQRKTDKEGVSVEKL